MVDSSAAKLVDQRDMCLVDSKAVKMVLKKVPLKAGKTAESTGL
jgi:hypothetical protein